MIGDNLYPTTSEKAERYDATISVFSGLLREIRELSRKKPEATLSKTKVIIINRVLEDVRTFLSGEVDDKYLDLLDDETLPQTSDAVLVMVQYEGALNRFRQRHYGWDGSTERWFIKD